MSTLDIQNCHVHIGVVGPSLHCDFDGARYHVWLAVDRTVQPPLYKNPPATVTPGSSGDYPTRKLSITSRFGARLVTEMLGRMRAEGLYEKAVEEHAQSFAKEEEERRRSAVQHLVIGTDREGQVHFVSDDGVLCVNIRGAAVFTRAGLEQAQAIASQPDLEQRRLCAQLAVISITAGDLERLLGEIAPFESLPPSR
jgi:hypothetical protein